LRRQSRFSLIGCLEEAPQVIKGTYACTLAEGD